MGSRGGILCDRPGNVQPAYNRASRDTISSIHPLHAINLPLQDGLLDPDITIRARPIRLPPTIVRYFRSAAR